MARGRLASNPAPLLAQPFFPRTAPLAVARRIGLLGGGGYCTLRRFRSGDHFIDADHEGVLDRSRLWMEKDRHGAVDIGILQVGQRRRGGLRAERLLEALARPG